MRSLILETANIQFKNYDKNLYKISNFPLKNPIITDDNKLENGTTIAKIIAPSDYSISVPKTTLTTGFH